MRSAQNIVQTIAQDLVMHNSFLCVSIFLFSDF
jgi:hypothetical protein